MDSPKLGAPADAAASPNALTKYSLLGSAAELERHALEQRPLLGSVCLTGEATVWYGKFGTGKTLIGLHLILEAIQNRRIKGDEVIYINADDSSAGLAGKVRLLEDDGAHVIAQGHRGFRSSLLTEKMMEMVEAGTARGVFVVIDTLKKFVDVMDKKATRAFNEAIRRFVMQGGTVLALAHTNKRPGADGKPIPEGTGDVLNDFDCGYLLDCVGEEKGTGNIVVEFSRVKSRGPAALKAHYAFDPDPELAYVERLCSVREIDPGDADYASAGSPKFDEADVIDHIELCLEHGTVTKMNIVTFSAKAGRFSRRTVLKVLEKYTGDDPTLHRWNFTRREHGRMVYELLARRSKAV